MSVEELLAAVAARGVELWAEGPRLRFRAPPGALPPEHRAALSARRAEVVGALRARAAAEARVGPLSHNQRALWFVALEAPASSAYNVAFTARVREPVDARALGEALQALVDRHAMLRTTYAVGDDGQPVQRTAGAAEVAFAVHDAAGLDEAALRARVQADYERPFDLERGPVFRASLYARGADDHVLLLAAHHIAVDGHSVRVLVEELGPLYAEARGAAARVPPRAEREYADFCEWQARMLAGPEGARLGDAWQARLRAPRAQVEPPADRPRPARKTFRGATVSGALPAARVAALRRAAREQGVTLFVLLLAAFDAMLYRLTGAEDLVVGTPMAGRPGREFARVVGHFVNPVPLRTAVRPGMPFRELVARVRAGVREALDGQDYPLTLMVQRAQPARDPSRSPLFETFFGLLSGDVADADAAGAETPPAAWEPYPVRTLEGQFDLALQLTERAGALAVDFRYNPDLFDAQTVERFLHHYDALLDGITVNVDATLETLDHAAPAGPAPGAGPDAAAADAAAGGGPAAGAEPVRAFLAALAARDVRVTLDGEKLKLNAPAGALDAALKGELAARKAEIVAALRADAAARPGALRRVPRTPPLPLSFAQQRLWFIDRMQPGSAHYNIPLVLRMAGPADGPALAHALDALVARHEPLRTRVRDDEGSPRAELAEVAGTAVRTADLTHLPPGAREAEATRLLAAAAREPFDLAAGPLARFVVARLSPDEHLVLICMHHIAADGWSLSVAARELCAEYAAAVAGRASPLPPLAVQYVDYAAWQRERMSAGLLARDLSYWQRELAGAPAVLELPADRPRPPVPSFRGRRIEGRMAPAQLAAVRALGRAEGATLYMVLLAAWQVVLHRQSGQEEVVVGSPLANRDRPELEPLIGCFVNNVALRGRLGGDPTFREYLAQVRSTVLGAFDHRELPFDRVVEALRPERAASHSPVFQVMLTLHSFPMEAIDAAGVRAEAVPLETGAARFDLTLEMDEHEGGLRMMLEYATDLFDAETAGRLHAQYLTLLGAAAADPGRRVGDLPLLAADEERALLARVNATAAAHDRASRAHDLVRAAAERTPDAVAVAAPDATLTYAELEARANRLARLLGARGVGRGALVGVCLDRTSWLPAALLGVLKAGAAYVPVDPAHPAERLAYTLDDAGVACVVTEARFAEAVAGARAPLVCVDADADAIAAESPDDPGVAVAADDLAYVIYTSGSTGRPKGVELEHRNLVNFLRAMQRAPGIGPADVLVAVTTPSFDIAGLELFLPLVAGARTVIAPRADVLDGARLAALLERSGATMLQATPATWRLLLDAGWGGKGDLVALCGGEALPRDLARALAPRVRALWNMYGPTETTVWSTVHRVDAPDRDVPIGRPVANTTVYVLDAAGRPAPVGVAGELCIGGEGVARGYRGRPELTAEKFVTFTPAGGAPERVYRTGDVVRLRADLALEFVGRRDHQVKLRGYRIELGEVESVLAEHPAVRRCAVVVREDAPGDARLVAYVVPADDDVPAEGLRGLLRARLPEYMIPSAIVPLAELPLTPNGKVDRKALPAPPAAGGAPGAGAASGPEPVMTPVQRRVADVWRQVLGAARVGLTDNFFDLGGHSLLVVRVHAALRREFAAELGGRELAVVDLFQRPTVAAQAELFASAAPDGDAGLRRAQARAARLTA